MLFLLLFLGFLGITSEALWQVQFGFMDSEVSLSFLESEEGKKAIVALHVEGIINYVEGILNK